jgi:hypothetical protein
VLGLIIGGRGRGAVRRLVQQRPTQRALMAAVAVVVGGLGAHGLVRLVG